MEAEERRRAIAQTLAAADAPVAASSLAARFCVSRQVIVGDVALLRASGTDITATPRGYVMYQERGEGVLRTVACIHDLDDMALELNIMVDNGCTVLDVVIEHAVYGQLTGELRLANRYDVSQFTERLVAEGAAPLSALTGGIHIHNLLCPDDEAFDRTCSRLDEAGLLYNSVD